MKRGIFLGLIVISLLININQIYATESSMSTNFNIMGCRMNNEFLTYNSCSRYGLYWCNYYGKLQDVFTETGACRGKNSDPAITEDDCCPPSYFCDSGETNICQLREYECSHFTQKDPCEDNGCIWWTEDPLNIRCINRNELSSCSDYKKNASCTRDLYGLGKTNGLGTDVCRGIYFGTKLTIINSCRCKWDGPGMEYPNGNCSLTYGIVDELDPYKNFTCTKKFSLGTCDNGQQLISWNVTPFSQGLTLTNDELIRFKCTDGTKTILCNYSTVKLPFFDFYNIIFASILITFTYIFLKKNGKIE